MIVVAGEALMDLVPRGATLLPTPGGSPYNVAVGLSRLGVSTTYLGALSRDGFGTALAQRLRAEGAGLELVRWTDAPTSLAVVHLDEHARATYGFYLEGTSAAGLRPVHLAELPPGAALHVSLGALGLLHDPAGSALRTLLQAEGGRRFVSFDPNLRPSAILGDVAHYARCLDEVVAGLALVKVSDEDLGLLRPGRDPMDLAREWAEGGPAMVVVTRGPNGAVALRPDHAPVEVAGVHVEVVDTVGAGDAFTAGLLAWLDRADAFDRGALRGLGEPDILAALGYAQRVAAITCTREGADPPRAAELDDPVAGQ